MKKLDPWKEVKPRGDYIWTVWLQRIRLIHLVGRWNYVQRAIKTPIALLDKVNSKLYVFPIFTYYSYKWYLWLVSFFFCHAFGKSWSYVLKMQNVLLLGDFAWLQEAMMRLISNLSLSIRWDRIPDQGRWKLDLLLVFLKLKSSKTGIYCTQPGMFYSPGSLRFVVFERDDNAAFSSTWEMKTHLSGHLRPLSGWEKDMRGLIASLQAHLECSE